MGKTLTIVREWVRAGVSPTWLDCAVLSTELCLWHLQFGNLSIVSDGLLWLSPCTSSDSVTTGCAIGRVPGVYPPIS